MLTSLLTFLKDIPLTFFSAPFYRALATSGKGIGIGFIIFITLLNIGRFTPSLMTGLGNLTQEQESLLSALPDIEIKNGVLSIQGDPKQDFAFLKEEDTGPFHIVLDMNTKALAESELTKKMVDEKIIIWANKDILFMYNHDEKALDRQDFSTFQDMVITHEDWLQTSEVLSSLVAPSALIGYGLLLFISHIALAFIGGVFIWVLAPLFKRQIDVQGATRIAAAAKVPVAFIFLIMTPATLFQTLFWFGFAMFALLSLKQVETEKG